MSTPKIIDTNIVTIVGVLTEVDMKEGTTADGREYISGKVNVKSVINNIEQITEVEFFTMKMTKAKAISKLYVAYKDLPNMLDKRVSIQGSLVENKFYNKDSSSVINYTRISGNFVNLARLNDVDKATFKIVGYVVQPVSEILDRDNKAIGHKIVLGVGNYNLTLPNYITLHINDSRIADIASGLYQTGDTIEVEGNYVVKTETETITREAAFGDLTDTKTRTKKEFVINSGSNPIDAGSYPEETIIELTKAYREHTLKVEADAKAKNSENGGNALGGTRPAPKTGLGASLL